MSAVAANVAGVRLSIEGGEDLSDKVNPRLVSLQLSETREDAADKIDITLQNTDGKLAPLRKGAVLVLALGWIKGSDVAAGLVEKGRFTVDEVEKSGPPNMVTIRARSADLTGAYRKRRDQLHKQTTLGAVIGDIAGRNNLTASVHADLAGKVIELSEQGARSDMAFVTELGKRFDAVATVKDKTLLLAPIGKGQSASGKSLPALVLTPRGCGKWRFTTASRGEHDGAEAQWHDPAAARRRTAKEGGSKNPKKLKRVYASEADASAAAKAEHQRQARGVNTFETTLAFGDPEIGPERPVTLQGWDSEIDGIRWVVKEATHSFSPNDGLTTRISLDSAG